MSVLSTSVLVLNQNYQPLNVCNVKRAIVLVSRGKAEIVEEGEGLLRSVARAFRVPSIIRMIYYIRRPHPAARLSRTEVFRRDRFTCQYCGCNGRDLTLDHVIPRHRGGAHSWENLVSACRRCNHRKAGRTPGEAGMRLRAKPHRPAAGLHLLFGRYLDRRPTWLPFFSARDAAGASLAASAGG